MKATEMLERNDGVVRRLFDEYRKGGKRPALEERKIFGEIFHELEIHIAIQEKHFFPALREATPLGAGAVDEALEDHRRIESILTELANLEPGQRQFESSIGLLRERVERHFEKEEGEIFPLAERALAARPLEELGARMSAHKSFLNGGAGTEPQRVISPIR